ncbi:hypothetical protein M9Y10_003153 [Tritrichomonas musculus]|uniref:Protein kinase domain-containing protein n=1 Tax=Tritrichomonas musculus TaxID=1915356 RepID=A0ABR2JNY4_9EUKA
MKDKTYQFDAHLLTKKRNIGKGDNCNVFSVQQIFNFEPIIKVYHEDLSNYSNEYIEKITNIYDLFSGMHHMSLVNIDKYSLVDFDNESKLSIMIKKLHNFTTIYDKFLSPDFKLSHTKQFIYIYSITLGMNYLHSNNIIHSNLNTKNIVIDDDNSPLINGYYSLSKFIHNKEDPLINEDCVFVAPEIWNGEEYTKASDVYSFAMIAYQILTLQKPFQNMNFFDIITNIVQGIRPEFNSNIPECYQQLIQKCWSSEPKDRPTFEEIAQLLKNDPKFIDEYDVKRIQFNGYLADLIIDQNSKIEHCNILTNNEQNNDKYDISASVIVLGHESGISKIEKESGISKFEKESQQQIFMKKIPINIKKENKIGEGGFGVVYKIYDENKNVWNVAKVSKQEVPNIFDSNDIVAVNFIRECNIMSEIDHFSILKYIDYYTCDFKDRERPVIITEYSPNGSLDKIIELEQCSRAIDDWDSTKKLICIYGIASAMAYLHKNDILHLDLKAANILIDENLFPKLSDFGMSVKIDELTDDENKKFKGTPTHAAPEVWKNLGYTKKVDVYAFAFTVYEIMTNEKPFSDLKSVYQIMKEVLILGNRPLFKYDIPNCYKKLIEKCWSQNPSDRPSFDDIIDQLKNNSDFVTEASADANEYYNFVDLVDNDPDIFKNVEMINKQSSKIIKKRKISGRIVEEEEGNGLIKINEKNQSEMKYDDEDSQKYIKED